MGFLTIVDTRSSIVAPFLAMVALGASHAFNNLGLQAELRHAASPAQIGTAAGFFQTARFVGAALGAGLVGLTLTNDAIGDDLHRLWIAAGILSFGLLVWAATSTRWKRLCERSGITHPDDHTHCVYAACHARKGRGLDDCLPLAYPCKSRRIRS
jgi:predicted MFS family arabinose efflux permease